MGKPALRKTKMKLQLADGYIENPWGLLEKVIVTSCGVEYKHTFAVVDFGKSPNYDIILGRPFMHQLKMVQDWGFNYLYLQQESAITQVKLRDQSYRDVAKMSIEDFESTTTSQPSWLGRPNQLWMCGALDNEEDHLESEDEGKSEVYVPNPSLSKSLSHTVGTTF